MACSDAGKCQGKTKYGSPCKKSSTQGNGFCKHHDPSRSGTTAEPSCKEKMGTVRKGPAEGAVPACRPCQGKLKDGSPCKNSSTQGNDFCKLHDPSRSGTSAGPSSNDKKGTESKGPSVGAAPACRNQKPTSGLMLAEEVQSIESIAKGYGTGYKSGNLLPIADKGKLLEDRATLLSKVPNKPGNYIWTVRPPRGKKAIAVYIGKAGGGHYKETLRGRFQAYLQKDFFGPVRESAVKCMAMVDVMCRGFRIEVRFRTGVHDAIAAEDATLSKYDFALNDINNGGRKGVRWPIAFGKNQRLPSDFDIINKELWDRICGAKSPFALAAAS